MASRLAERRQHKLAVAAGWEPRPLLSRQGSARGSPGQRGRGAALAQESRCGPTLCPPPQPPCSTALPSGATRTKPGVFASATSDCTRSTSTASTLPAVQMGVKGHQSESRVLPHPSRAGEPREDRVVSGTRAQGNLQGQRLGTRLQVKLGTNSPAGPSGGSEPSGLRVERRAQRSAKVLSW